MIDRAALTRLSLVAAVVCAVAAAVAFAIGGGKAAGGVAIGAVMGLIPFLSWTYIARAVEASPRHRLLAALLLIGKMGLYAVILYFTVSKHVVEPAGLMAGIGLVTLTFVTGTLLAPKKEARA